MSIDQNLQTIDRGEAHAVLVDFLKAYTTPAFGALPKREVDLLVFKMMHRLGVISEDASIYELMRDLRVSRPRARGLLFDLEVRRADDNPDELIREVRELVLRGGFVKDGSYFVIEVENPLVQDHLREMVRRKGFLTDTSFNAALVRMPLPAVSAVAEELIPEKDREKVRKALVKAGAPDTSLRGVLQSALTALGEKVIGEASGQIASGIVGGVSEFLGPVFSGATGAIGSVWDGLFGSDGDTQ